MGWPRKHEMARIYRDTDQSYFLVFPEMRNGRGNLDAIANVFEGNRPTLASTAVDPGYLQFRKRVQWDELPEDWQRAFLPWVASDDDPDQTPESIRGFWRIGRQPVKAES